MAQPTAMATPKFGTQFTGHMLEIEWDAEKGGWQGPLISKFHHLPIHPAAKVLQYSTSAFEGMKAYRGDDGRIYLFRPKMNIDRLNRSANRSCLPATFDPDLLLQYIKKLIWIDRDYMPNIENASFYIRPTYICQDADLSLDLPQSKGLLYVILSQCYGSFFGKPVTLYADPNYVRAWPGGSGDHKVGANYGPTFLATKVARKNNCDQVLWLFGNDEQLTEVGSMSLFILYLNEKGEKELITPPLEGGLILPSITRHSILELARSWNDFVITERRITMKEFVSLKKQDRILEVFGAGTACVVTPVVQILYKGEFIKVPTLEQPSPLYSKFLSTLENIQYGRISSPWSEEVTSPEHNGVNGLTK